LKLLFSIAFIVLVGHFAHAQSDTVSIFHKSNSPINGKSSGHFGTYKNVLSINFFQAVRGGLLVNYERMIGQSGLAFSLGTGICSFDPLGQFYVREFQYYYELNLRVINRESTELLPLFDFATKYYFEKEWGALHIDAGYTNIKNNVTLDFSYSPDYYFNLNTKLKKLNYRNNEFKLLVGFTNDTKKKFYHDFSLGLGYRFIEYDYLEIEKLKISPNSSDYVNTLIKKTKTNQTPWLAMSWRMGIRF
jgi:hypothetical protein